MTYTTLLVDLDDTVYPADNGLWEAIAARIDLYMQERLGLQPAEIPALRKNLHARYGTTLRGLAATRRIDENDYLAFVHDIPVTQYLTPDPQVRASLLACPLRRFIFTNADRSHAGRVLAALKLEGVFEAVIDINDVRPYCKPMPEAFALALEKAGAQAAATIFLDDAASNLTAARTAGITPIQVSGRTAHNAQIAHIPSLADLPRALAPYLPAQSAPQPNLPDPR